MRRVAERRRDHLGVLRGRPGLDPRTNHAIGPRGLRRVDEVRQLLQLVDRGLLSEEEFANLVLSVYGARGDPGATPPP